MSTDDFPLAMFANKDGFPCIFSAIQRQLALSVYCKFANKLNVGAAAIHWPPYSYVTECSPFSN